MQPCHDIFPHHHPFANPFGRDQLLACCIRSCHHSQRMSMPCAPANVDNCTYAGTESSNRPARSSNGVGGDARCGRHAAVKLRRGMERRRGSHGGICLMGACWNDLLYACFWVPVSERNTLHSNIPFHSNSSQTNYLKLTARSTGHSSDAPDAPGALGALGAPGIRHAPRPGSACSMTSR